MYCDIPEFGRCCFCMPLRRGVLVFGYMNVLFSAFMIGVYSYFNMYYNATLFYKGVSTYPLPTELCIAIFCMELIISCVLVYGTHTKMVKYLKFFYYYTMVSVLVALVMQIVALARYREFELLVFAFAGLIIQIYLLLLVRSLLKKLEIGQDNAAENQLHDIVFGETTEVHDRIYNNTTVTPIKEDL